MTSCDTLQVSEAELDQSMRWTEDDYLALGETKSRIELIDGGLWMSPFANYEHTRIGGYLKRAFEPRAETIGLLTNDTNNVRLAAARIVIPDLVIINRRPDAGMIEAASVVLVAEITSPSNATYDRILKKHLYAAAQIPWYLLAEPDVSDYESIELHLFRLSGDIYVEHAFAKQGERLTSSDPFAIDVDTEDLIRYVRAEGWHRG
jgi:Uma2 family endonuclease